MLKRVLGIAAIVLLSNTLALVTVARNARGPVDTLVTLTEREARLLGTPTDNTGMMLLLQWEREPVAAWFDRAKLVTLGFDCSVDPGAANAWRHYEIGTLPRQTNVVLEYDPGRLPAEGPVSGAQAGKARPREFQPRLRPIDAGNDASALRARYTDRGRYVISAAVVAAWLHRPSPRDRYELNGRIVQVLPNQVYVPRELQATMRAAVGKNDSWDEPLTRPPRYEVTLEYRSSLLPRAVAVKKIAP